MKKFLVVLFVLTALISFAEEKVIIEADKVTSTDETVYHAVGNVKIFQGERTMLADEVFYFKDINFLEARDNVRLTENGEVIDCSKMEYDTAKKTGVFYEADGFMEPYNWFKAKEAYKTGTNSYTLKKARYTTCSGDNPAWSISATTADIDVGGYLSAYNVAGWANKVPVFYTPYIIYPIKTERESGFLIPALGSSSKDGLFIQPQYFWNIDVDKDMTFAALFSQKSDTLYANEFRMTPGIDSRFYNYLEYSGEVYEKPDENPGNNNVESKSGRYFLYNSSNLKISDNLRLYLDLETVSDYGYLDDYEKYSILKDYNNDDNEYINNIQLAFTSELSNVTLRYNDTMSYSVSDTFLKENTYMMPSIVAEQDISTLPINIRYYLSYDRVKNTKEIYNYTTEREEERELNYTRNHATFMFYKPFPIYIGTITPSAKLYYTKWYDIESNYGITLPENDRLSSYAYLESDGSSITRRAYTLKTTLALNEIYRQYAGFKHSIYNNFTYVQTPEINQTNLFDYVYEDIVSKEKKYQYTLQNYFNAKNWFLKLENTQGYEMTKPSRRLDPLITKVNYNYMGYYSMYLEDEYNHYDKMHDFFRLLNTFKVGAFTLTMDYTYDKDTSDDQNTTLKGSVTYSTPKYDFSYSRTSSGWNKELSFKTEESVDDTLAIDYKSECWQIGVAYSRNTEIDNVAYGNSSTTEHVVMLTLGLRGMGKFSSSLFHNNSEINGENNE